MAFPGGVVTTGPNFGQADYLVRAYDLLTGASAWQERSAAGGYYDLITSIAVQGTHVIAAGGRYFNFIARAYNIQTGALAWQGTFDTGYGFDETKHRHQRHASLCGRGSIHRGNSFCRPQSSARNRSAEISTSVSRQRRTA